MADAPRRDGWHEGSVPTWDPEEDLEKILSAAKSAGVAVLGFDDLK